ncbi:MAG TPA: DNA alkylation repair protein [Cyclobacteriaceae bacterium]|nr:DNA alkylation repair protein [Cyclobacteriaceae bacterium]
MNKFHTEVLALIEKNSGTPTQHTFLDSYLGNDHPRYAINAPTMRTIGNDWMRSHKQMSADEFGAMLTSLSEGKSGTEKVMIGILLDNATAEQKQFDPTLFDKWLDQLVGWAEVDSVCTGKYCITEIPNNIPQWKKILTAFSKSKNINKRRASIVFLCSPVSQSDDPRLAEIAFANIDRLKSEKEIIITRAISWVLRSMYKHHKKALEIYLKKNEKTLPAIAVRETKIKLKTGKKSSAR